VAFFTLSSLCSWLTWRLGGRRGWYALSIISLVLAQLSKQNAFTFPLIIAATELMFFSPSVLSRKRRLAWLLPVMLTMCIVPAVQLYTSNTASETGGIDVASSIGAYAVISGAKAEYLISQFSVLVTYLRLMALPVGQNFDYDYPGYGSLLEPQAALSFVLLLSVFLMGVYAFWCSREGRGSQTRGELALVSWGILWFFVTLAVESSILVIPMLITEYRLYLPSIGLIIAIVSMFMLALHGRTSKVKSIGVIALIMVLLMFSVLTVQRNAIWGGKITLWEDVVRKSPQKARRLAHLYEMNRDMDKAEYFYERTMQLDKEKGPSYMNAAIFYATTGRLKRAIELMEEVRGRYPLYADARYTLGSMYMSAGRLNEARGEFMRVLKLRPGDPEAIRFLRYLEGTRK